MPETSSLSSAALKAVFLANRSSADDIISSSWQRLNNDLLDTCICSEGNPVPIGDFGDSKDEFLSLSSITSSSLRPKLNSERRGV